MKFFADISLIRDFTDRFKASTYWKDVAWLSSGTVVAQAITLATMPLFTRIFMPEDFAVQNLFGQIAGLVAVVATLRYEYFIQLPKQDDDALLLVKLIAILGFFVALGLTPVMWLFRDIIARWAGDAALSVWLVFVPATAAAMSLAIALQGWTQRQLHFRRSGEAEVVGKASYSITTFAGWFFFPGAGGLVMSSFGAALGKIVWLSRGILYTRCGKYSDIIRMARVFMRPGGSLVLSHGLLACTVAIPSVFIARTYGSETLGQYALSYFVVCFPSALLGGAIGNVYYQRASERWVQGFNFADIWRSTAQKLLLIGLPLYGAAILITSWLFPLLFGNVWGPAGYYAAILAISAFFSFATSPMSWACLVVGAWWYVPLWHAARTLTTGIVAGMALLYQWNMDVFISVLVIQQTALYLIDYWAEWRFAHRQPPHTPPTGDIPCVGL
jgi:O-antigen/teichoic acid export membrane protein